MSKATSSHRRSVSIKSSSKSSLSQRNSSSAYSSSSSDMEATSSDFIFSCSSKPVENTHNCCRKKAPKYRKPSDKDGRHQREREQRRLQAIFQTLFVFFKLTVNKFSLRGEQFHKCKQSPSSTNHSHIYSSHSWLLSLTSSYRGYVMVSLWISSFLYQMICLTHPILGTFQ